MYRVHLKLSGQFISSRDAELILINWAKENLDWLIYSTDNLWPAIFGGKHNLVHHFIKRRQSDAFTAVYFNLYHQSENQRENNLQDSPFQEATLYIPSCWFSGSGKQLPVFSAAGKTRRRPFWPPATSTQLYWWAKVPVSWDWDKSVHVLASAVGRNRTTNANHRNRSQKAHVGLTIKMRTNCP